MTLEILYTCSLEGGDDKKLKTDENRIIMGVQDLFANVSHFFGSFG